MATIDQCRTALDDLAARLASADGSDSPHHGLRRSLSCTLTDLGVTFSGELDGGRLVGITTDPVPRAQIRLAMTSDDLIALTSGDLHFAHAWLGGRVSVEAGVRDLLRLRALI